MTDKYKLIKDLTDEDRREIYEFAMKISKEEKLKTTFMISEAKSHIMEILES